MDLFEFSIFIIIIAFFCEYIDSSLGMGYGTALTPILLIMGYTPLQIVPAVLLSELITGLSAAFFHHRLSHKIHLFSTSSNRRKLQFLQIPS